MSVGYVVHATFLIDFFLQVKKSGQAERGVDVLERREAAGECGGAGPPWGTRHGAQGGHWGTWLLQTGKDEVPADGQATPGTRTQNP